MATYLDLVNMAIWESGADLDELDSITFEDPSQAQARQFKRAVRQAWNEIQLESNDWQFQSKTAQVILRPRLLVTDGDRSVAPPAGSTFQGDDTDATFEVVNTILLDGTWAGANAVALIEYTDIDGQFKWHELYDELTPTDTNTDVFRLKGWGRYNLQFEVSDLLEPDLTTFFVQSTGGSVTQDNTADADNGPVVFLPWPEFLRRYEGDQTTTGRPEFFTITPDGWMDFFPRLDQEYVLTFTYTAEPQELNNWDDEPDALPLQYQDMIAWRAIMHWADKQERPSQFARAERRYEFFKNRMEKNQKPQWSFAADPFTGGFR